MKIAAFAEMVGFGPPYVESRAAAPPVADGPVVESEVSDPIKAMAATGTTAARDIAVGLWTRAAYAADVSDAAITPAMLAVAVADILTCGATWWVFLDGRWWWAAYTGEAASQPEYVILTVPTARSAALLGGVGPHLRRTVTIQRSAVVYQSWEARAAVNQPLTVERSETARGLREGERAIANELSGPVGGLITYPAGTRGIGKRLHAAMSTLAGGWRLVRSAAGGAVSGQTVTGTDSYRAVRVGPSPPAGLITAVGALHDRVMSAYGVSPGLWANSGPATREAWRLFLASSVEPVLSEFVRRCAVVMGRPVTVKWSRLERADLQVQARALTALVAGGVEPERARRIVGLD